MTTKIPKHLAVIMDGNGRWAKARGLPRLAGHRKGAQVLKDLVQSCLSIGIQYLTVYAFSSENWNRPISEVSGLLNLMEVYLDREEKALLEQEICLRVIGEKERLPLPLRERIERLEQMSASKARLFFQVALSYGSREEILHAARLVARDVSQGHLCPETITEDTFASYLYTAGVPDPDLLIRTSGEQRLSNYLLWQMAYTEFMFLPKYWPDFNHEDLEEALQIYEKRERRFGLAS